MAERWQQWMPWHIDRFKGSPAVQAMHPTARAGYFYLLGCQWQTDDCTISADPMDLADMSGLGDELWALHSARILRNFKVLEDGRLQNKVLLEEWTEAKRVFDARRDSAHRTNNARSPHGHRKESGRSPLRSADTQTGTGTGTTTGTETGEATAPPAAEKAPVGTVLTLPKPDPTHSVPDSVDNRVLCERVGIFDMRQQSDMQKLYEVYARSTRKDAEAAMEHMVSRWVQYGEEASCLEWQYGSAHKFFMSGKWDDPRSWPRAKAQMDVYERYMAQGG